MARIRNLCCFQYKAGGRPWGWPYTTEQPHRFRIKAAIDRFLSNIRIGNHRFNDLFNIIWQGFYHKRHGSKATN
jgi:hypothetical protein